MEESEYKDKEKVLFKTRGKLTLPGKEPEEADCFVTERHVLIETEEPLKIPVSRVQECDIPEVVPSVFYPTGTATLTFLDDLNKKHKLSLELPSRDLGYFKQSLAEHVEDLVTHRGFLGEENEYKDNEKVLYKTRVKPLGMKAKEADFFVTEGHVIIEVEEPIKIPMSHIESCHSPADGDPATIMGAETAQTTTVTLTYRDTSGQSRAMKFDMSMRDARSLSTTLEAARRKLLQAAGILPYAGFWLRFAAYIIDAVILNVISWILGWILLAGAPPAVAWVGIIITIAYFIGFWTWRGQTLGKMAVGVKIVKTDGSPIGIGRAILRYIGYFVSSIILCIGHLMIAGDKRKQGLHDKIAGTCVVKTRYLG